MRTAPYYNMASIRPRWSADGKAIAYLADTSEGSALWTMKADGSEARAIVPGVLGFDWYLDSRRIVYSRMAEGRDDVREMRARNLETGDEVVLLQSPHQELIVSADGTSVAYCNAASHYDMDLYRLKLQVPADANGLPTVVGEPQRLTEGQERWHVHNGSWSPDGKQIVYTRDTDSADISIIEGMK